MKKLFLLLVPMAIFAVGCQNNLADDVIGTPIEKDTTITISLADTRISLGEKIGENYPVFWDNGDKIVINGVLSKEVQIDSDNKSKATFSVGTTLDYPYAIIYPYCVATTAETPIVEFPAEQNYAENTFAAGYAPMCGYVTEKEDMTILSHLAGVLRLAVKGSTTLSSIEIIANEGVALAGEFGVDCKNAATTAIEGKTVSKITYIANHTLSMDQASIFHITIPAGDFGECKVVLTDKSGLQMNLKWNATNIKAGIVREFKAFSFKGSASFSLSELPAEEDELYIPKPTPVAQKSNEIWYTSTDGEVVNPYNLDYFNANIVSNTYENGRGVITFNVPLSKIGYYAFYRCTNLTSVSIPDGVTWLDYSAFEDCSSLTSITIPDSVTSIWMAAFDGCSSLKSVTIPDGVTKIAQFTFNDCSSLISVIIPDSVTSIGDSAFRDCTSLTSVNIGNSVTSIGNLAFYECSSLTSITIPDNLTEIGQHAFDGCSSLTSATIPDSVTSIGEYAFYNCSGLKSNITIPDSITSIGDYAFAGCTGKLIINSKTLVETDYTSDFNPYIQSPYNSSIVGWFYDSKFTELTIGNNITKIGNYAFCDCDSLTSITIPDSVTSIGDYAFGWSSSLTNVTIGNGVTSIGEHAFDWCSSLTSVTIPDSVTSIGDSAFYECESLKSATIGDSVISIGSSAFRGCSSLTSVTIPDSVTSIGSSAFSGCSKLTSVTIGNSVTSIGNSAFSSCTKLTSITIPDSVTSIGERAFYYCISLTSFTIPDSVTSIGEWAFRSCSRLTSVTIGNSVTSIGDYAFFGCKWLTSVYCKPTTPPTGGVDMFDDNDSGRKIYVPRNSVDIYKQVKYWTNYASSIVGYDF